MTCGFMEILPEPYPAQSSRMRASALLPIDAPPDSCEWLLRSVWKIDCEIGRLPCLQRCPVRIEGIAGHLDGIASEQKQVRRRRVLDGLDDDLGSRFRRGGAISVAGVVDEHIDGTE